VGDGRPWPLHTYGLRFGEPLSDLLRRGLALRPDLSDAHLVDGVDAWTNPTGSILASTCGGLIATVSLSDSAVLDGVELVGLTRQDVCRVIGFPTGHDEITGGFEYDDGAWSLSIGFDFDSDRVAWLILQRGDLYDQAEAGPP
jgi:hypothetical protein